MVVYCFLLGLHWPRISKKQYTAVVPTGVVHVIPAKQAVCSRHALRIGSKVVPLVKVIIVILYPITKPLSLLLDK